MTGAGNPRWLLSFADLLMLLLAFFVVLGASKADPVRMSAGLRAAFGGQAAATTAPAPASVTLDPERLFEPGEAVFRAGRAAPLAALGRRFGTRRVTLTSSGQGAASGRLDRFELAAARTAAIGRALDLDGGRLAIAMQPGRAGAAQRVTVQAVH